MAVMINHNLMAMTAARHLGSAYDRMSTSTERLSSGLRINSAADDAAGLAVRENMRSDIAVLNQGVRNANDAISMIQTADGALQVIDEKLIRMKELAEQAATGTYTSAQRAIMNSEYQEMASEITRIAHATDFNGTHLLNSGTNQITIHFGAGNDAAEDKYAVTFEDMTATTLGVGSVGDAADIWRTTANVTSAAGTIIASNNGTDFAFSVNGNAATISLSSGGYTLNELVSAINDGQSLVTASAEAYGGLYHLKIQTASSGAAYDFKVNSGPSEIDAQASEWVHLQESAGAGGAGDSITTQSLAQSALGKLDTAIQSKESLRALIGSMSNRLENTVTNLTIQAENLQAAESRVSDVDVATEMTEFTKNNIIVQAATAMLAQANSLPQLALQLLQG